ncbi:MAG: class I SAM-dependent methyltransferase [SAR202 cluster bacterium]|nr:class I SAM-dependent methyltransferase [SAR202 cluster bacterium]
MNIVHSLYWWLLGCIGILRQVLRLEKIPAGHSGALLSPLLETLRVRHAAQWIEGQTVLDCGCGRGRLLSSLAKGVAYTGVDNDPELIAYLRQRHPDAQFIQGDLTSLKLGDQVFDSIAVLAVIEHISSPQSFIRQIAAHLKPGGVLVLTTPAPSFEPLLHIGSRLGLFSRHAEEDHKRLLDRSALEQVARTGGLVPGKHYRFLFGANQLLVARKPASD